MTGRKDQHDGSSGRTEPTLGDLDHLDAPPPAATGDDGLPRFSAGDDRRRGTPPSAAPPPKPSRGRRRGWLVPLLLLVGIGVGTTLWLEQDQLRGMVPDTELDGVLGRAETALQQGHLDGSDGTSARELFEAARALQPDNDRARDGLHRVGQAEVASADAALRAGHLGEAEQALAAARELLGGGADVDRLTQAIAAKQLGAVPADKLIEQAQQAFDAGKLDGDDGAGPLYRRVLSADPSNAVAAHGLDKVGEALAAQAHKALDAGDPASAASVVDRLATLMPSYGELPALRAALAGGNAPASAASVPANNAAALATDIQQGQDALRAGRVTGDGDDTALAHFKAAIAIDPDNADAKDGLAQVAQALIVRANAVLEGGDTAQARKLLDQAAELAPQSPDLADARARLAQDAQPTQAPTVANNNGATQHPALTPAQQADLQRILQRADAAAHAGQIVLPPGDSAYDLYRSALAIDANNDMALHGMASLSGLVKQQFNQSLSGGNLGAAGDRLADLQDIAPGDASAPQLTQQLSSAWMDRAQQQLQDGDNVGAAQSLGKARKLSPDSPRLSALASQLSAGP